ncbi:Isopenicillin N epimerase component 1 [Golovinomyces cichoracearum]|uniref:Isopenicillin N epimerase component 1 n=1 Tax=Golovinomyces cichoracearum TaxID=62708 RepID=A0A420HHL3_9PEZI|nr:Isopenicillin N epimerase component 1 [Golovinomyces cichoracearum]
MVQATGAAIVAGTVLAGMYAEAKFALYKDLTTLKNIKQSEQKFIETGESKLKKAKKNRTSLYYLFEESVLRRPNEECIWSREGIYSWSQVYRKVNQYGNWFLSLNVRAGDFVAIYLTNSPDFMFVWLGLLSIGAAPVLINTNLTGNALLHCLKIGSANILLVDEDEGVRERVESTRERITKETGITIITLLKETKNEIYQFESKRPDDSHRRNTKGDSPMALFYTRYVAMNNDHRKLLIKAVVQLAFQKLFRSMYNVVTTWYICMPLYHATGGMIALSGITNGSVIAIGKKFSTTNFWRDIHDSQATWICYVGEIARYLLLAPPSSLDTGHNVKGVFGNGLRPDVWIKFRDRFKIDTIIEFFSSSEGVFTVTNNCRGDYLAKAVGHHGALFRFLTRNVIVPVLIDTVTGDIVRDPKTGFAYRQPYEKGGEIIVKAVDTNIFPGYRGDDKATEKKFAHDVFQKGDLWYRTGDALRRTNDGRWFFMDRLGDTYRWKGENVSTAEVAETLGQYPGIVQANVYGITLPNHDGKVGCAAIYIDPKLRDTFDFSDFFRHNHSLLSKHAVPQFLRILKEISLTHNFKQNKVTLREEGVDPEKVASHDEILWIGREEKGLTYRKFLPIDWNNLKCGKSRL